MYAEVAELADARDSKSRGSDIVSVRPRPSAPNFELRSLLKKGTSMFDSSCVFCKIIQGIIPSTIIKENEYIKVITNIHPKAPIHYLILTKKHFLDIKELTDADQIVGWEILKTSRDLAKETNVSGFNLVSNNGQSAGQSIMHLHFHFLAGKNIYSGGFTL
jgi:diadenosine tetraphosphate (Ap4A) HIT family hydrolase